MTAECVLCTLTYKISELLGLIGLSSGRFSLARSHDHPAPAHPIFGPAPLRVSLPLRSLCLRQKQSSVCAEQHAICLRLLQ